MGKSCTVFQYSGKAQKLFGEISDSKQVIIEYWFSADYIEVNQEYLVHDIDSLIGNVGGTLGMFIGFSIRKTLSYFIDVLKNYLD